MSDPSANEGRWAYRVFKQDAFVYVRFEGPLSMTTFMAARGAASIDPRFDRSFRSLLDLRGCTTGDLSVEDIGLLTSHSTFRPGVTRGLVVDSDALHQLAEHAGLGGALQIFGTLQAALAAYGLPHLHAELETLLADA